MEDPLAGIKAAKTGNMGTLAVGPLHEKIGGDHCALPKIHRSYDMFIGKRVNKKGLLCGGCIEDFFVFEN